jgi:Tfp pilus assembly protein PilN
MRAVNLIPADERRAAGGAGKSGGAVYVLLAAVALIVAMVAALTMTNRQIADETADADRFEAQASAAQARAGSLATYKQFDQLVVTRSASVRALAATRFDWHTSLEQVSRVVPSDVSLTQLTATVAPGSAAAVIVPLRNALSNPAIELVGCAPSQARVALLMARLRRLEGIQRVTLQTSAKPDGGASDGTSSSGGATPNGCQKTAQTPQFGIVAFFDASRSAATATTAASTSSAANPGS